MTTVSHNAPARNDSQSFNQLVADAYSRTPSVIEPLGFSLLTVGVLTPMGVVPVVTVQKSQKAFGSN